MRTVFMGSPEFAVPSLLALHAATEVVAVVCQPDRPAGRGLTLLPPAVKRKAEELGLPVLQPTALRPAKSSFVEELKALRPELLVVVAYGRILPPEVLAVPRHGCWNVHGSLLPAYRGAAPIQWALIRGEATTGVTLMQMDAGMDTGPMLLLREQAIDWQRDTAGTLHESLSVLGAGLLAEGLARLQAGEPPPPVAQDEARASKAPLLDKEHGRADFTRPARLVVGQLRGVDPWPGGFTTLPAAADLGGQSAQDAAGEPIVMKLFLPRLSSGSGTPGEILGVDKDGVHVACGEGAVAIPEVQLPGRRRMPAQAAWAGLKLPRGLAITLGDGKRNPLLY
jgi:methionyl-tRNA formyltransferase